VKSLADVIAFNEKNKTREMPYFGQDQFVKAEAKGPLTSYEYVEALAKCRRMARTEGIDAVMDMARTSINLVGNCLATAVMARCEDEFGRSAADEAQITKTPEQAVEVEDAV
jgi:hypothetical protein